LVEFIVLEKLGSGDRFLVEFTVKKAIRVFDPCGPLNNMMGSLNELQFGEAQLS
jgi:hypothetical protein